MQSSKRYLVVAVMNLQVTLMKVNMNLLILMQMTNCDTDPVDYDSEPKDEAADLGENLLNENSNDDINHECFQTLVSLQLFFCKLARCLH